MNPFKEKKDFLFSLKRVKESNKPIEKIIRDEKEIICPDCNTATSRGELKENFFVCQACDHHFNISAKHRINRLVDYKSYREIGRTLKGENPLNFPGYDEKLEEVRDKTKVNEGVTIGTGRIDGHKAVIGVMDNRFLMGSMGMAVGEKITRAFEYATRHRLPIVLFCTSGGARMQEGILSLFQMAKTSAAARKHSEAGLLYISVLTNPTTGGVTASFASLGDITLAEPRALIGFAGPRVIEQTINQKLPEGFQRSEYLKEHGFVDAIVKRRDMRDEISLLLKIHDRHQGRRFGHENK